MLPSTPPVDSRFLCMGCQAMVMMSFSWPRSSRTSRIMRRSKMRAVWSRAQVASRLPWAGSNMVLEMGFLWPCRVVRQRAVRGSQNLTWWSLEPETSRPLWGCQSTDLTSQPWPVRVSSSWLEAKSQILRVVSSAHVTNLESVGAMARPRTASVWAWISLTLLKLVCQYLTTPVWSAESSQSSVWVYSTQRMAASWACMMVSKLKPMPFHRVNSPLVEPVSRRRPSGVHLTTLMGCLTLLSDEWTAFAGIDSAARARRAAGGTMSTM